ncbi:hypothetical protein KC717_07020, partial [Candidatus Dojkabacteria bacterium]|nr:hypothetical protein [Candidatus Dojkabacteria bacterium]
GYVLLNHKYLTSATRCKSDQNVIILSELENILKIQYYRLFTNEKGGKFSRQYHVQLHPAIAQELSDTGFCDSKSYPDFFRTTYNNRNIFNKDIRSNVHAHESNFSQTSEAISTSVKPIRLNRRKPNERKKPINADRKAKVVHFKQYKEPKNLKDHYPLNQEDCRTLQRTSGRLFTLNAMNEILLNISNKRDRRFCSKAQFLVYFTYVLKYELRDAVKTSNDKFHIKANYPHLYGNTGIVTKKAQEEAPPIVLPEGICGEFYKKLLQVYDVFVYQNWFKGLTYTANEETRCLELKALDECRTQWIETNYLNTMQKIAKSLNMEVILCKK